MKKRTLNADETAAVLRLRRTGEPMIDIAADLGVPHALVIAACRDANLIRIVGETGGRRHTAWLPEDDALLRDLTAAGLPVEDIADGISRSAHAVRNRMSVIGVTPAPSPTKAIWTPANVMTLRQMVRDSFQLSDIARHFQTTPSAIATKCAKLGIRTSMRLSDRERTGLSDCLRNGWTSAVRISRQIGVPVEIVQHHMRMRETLAA